MQTNNKNYDSGFCGSLPLQFINQVQPYGFLVVTDESSRIIQVSENIEAFTSLHITGVIDTPFNSLLGEHQFQNILQQVNSSKGKLPFSIQIQSKEFNTMVHRKDGQLIFEIERKEGSKDSFNTFFHAFKFMMNEIESIDSIEELSRHVLAQLKSLLGLDRIMIYQFDKDWNGLVIGEVLEDDMEPYLGLHFPASDVPRQARALYEKNAFRMIPDREFVPVKLYPIINSVTNKFTDLSECNLRSVAGVHIEYLRNMNVKASMSMRLMVNGKLWGLISCHHKTPMKLSFEQCGLFELLSTIISNRISLIVNKQYFDRVKVLQDIKAVIVQQVIDENDLSEGLINQEQNLLDLLGAEGIIINEKEGRRVSGKVPSEEMVDDLVMWLGSNNIRSLFYSDSYSLLNETAKEYTDVGSGIIVLPVNADSNEYIIAFRPEVVKSLNWGGNPNEAIQFESDGKKYHPRNSFRMWQETVKGISRPWQEEELVVAEQLRSFAVEFRFRIHNVKGGV
jgi:two-component system, chemotaxis family, sensor kinase Cph1